MGELQEGIKNEAIRNLTLWQMMGNFIREEDAKRKDYVHVKTVLKIVGEMQKEFPHWSEVAKDLKEKFPNKTISSYEVLNETDKRKDAWFERWLADE